MSQEQTNASFAEKSVFGQIKLYPMNDAAKAICALIGTKTFPGNPDQYLAINKLNIAISIIELPTK